MTYIQNPAPTPQPPANKRKWPWIAGGAVAAAIYANEDQQVLFEEINPGNTVKGKLVFDIPKGAKLASLEPHDSMFSGGVTVSLR